MAEVCLSQPFLMHHQIKTSRTVEIPLFPSFLPNIELGGIEVMRSARVSLLCALPISLFVKMGFSGLNRPFEDVS